MTVKIQYSKYCIVNYSKYCKNNTAMTVKQNTARTVKNPIMEIIKSLLIFQELVASCKVPSGPPSAFLEVRVRLVGDCG
jgi:hypothetical protein